MKQLFTIILLLIGIVQAYAQQHSLGLSKQEIIKTEGKYFGEGTDPDGTNYISYSQTIKSDKGDYRQSRVYYFNDKDICTSMVIFDPAAKSQSWEEQLDKKFTKLNKGVWKEFTPKREILWKIEPQEKYVMLHIYYGNPLERVHSN